MSALRALLVVVATTLALGVAHAQQNGERLAFSIAAQPLEQALMEFGSATGWQVLFSSKLAADRKAPAVSGEMTPLEALQKLLKGSSLRVEMINPTTVAIREGKVEMKNVAVEKTALVEIGQERVRLAQADAPDVRPQDTPPGASSGFDSDTADIQQVVVTGSHIRGSATPVGSELIVIDRDYIEKSGYSTVQDVLRTLPQAAPGPKADNPGGINGSRITQNFGLASGVDLRGLGAGATLVLVDGARQAAAGIDGGFVDVSNIPLSAVERIDILPDGASAIYGSDAVGGVVNIVLRRNYQGAETRLHFGSKGGDANDITVSQLFGRGWGSGHATAGLEYRKQNALLASDRAFSANSDKRSLGGTDFTGDSSNPANIYDPFTGELGFAIPHGQDGTNLTPDQLIPIGPGGAGANRMNENAGRSLFPEEKSESVFFSLNQSLGERLTLSADGRYNRRPIFTDGGPSSSGGIFLVSPKNPYFVDVAGDGTPYLIGYNTAEDLRNIQDGTTKTYSGSLGLEAKLPGEWRVASRATVTNQHLAFTISAVDSGLFEEALGNYFDPEDPDATDDPATDFNPLRDGFFNPFGDGSHTSQAVLDAIRTVTLYDATWRALNAGVNADGPLFDAPGGTVRLAFGVDYNRQKGDTGDEFSRVTASHSTLSSKAVYMELLLPLVGTPNEMRALKQLRLSLAGRYEDYGSDGTTFNPKIGLVANPVSAFTLRGTWGTSYKVPTIVDRDTSVFNPGFASVRRIPDPTSPTGTSRALVSTGVNPALREERARSWTTGFDIKSSSPLGPSLSVTYYSTNYKDRIGQGPLDIRTILADEAVWQALIIRNPTQAQIDAICADAEGRGTPNCAATNPALIVDDRTRNIAVQRVRGIDIYASTPVKLPRGDLTLGLAGNVTLKNEVGVTPQSQRLDQLDRISSPLSLKARATVDWAYRSLSFRGVFNYVPAYNQPLGNPDLTTRRLPAWSTFDVGARWASQYAKGWLEGASVQMNVENVFDKEPPFANLPLGYDGSNSNPFGRSFSVLLGKAW